VRKTMIHVAHTDTGTRYRSLLVGSGGFLFRLAH